MDLNMHLKKLNKHSVFSILNNNWKIVLSWICVLSFAMAYIGQPLLYFILDIFGKSHAMVTAAELPMESLVAVTFALLGVHSYDSKYGIGSNKKEDEEKEE